MESLLGLSGRAAVVVLCIGLFLRAYPWIRRSSPAPVVVVFDFAVLSYSITFFLGMTLLFLFEDNLLDFFFGGVMYIPHGIPYWSMWFISAMPFGVIIGMGYVAGLTRRGAPGAAPSAPPLRETRLALLLGAGAILLLSGAILWQVAPALVQNAFSFSNLTASHNLYQSRYDVTAQLHAYTCGFIYGTLPCVAAILLLSKVPGRPALLALGAIVGVFTIALNLGLYLAGTALTEILILVFLQSRTEGRPFLSGPRVVALPFMFVALLAYDTLKPGMSSASLAESLLQLPMRLPSATPYLFDMAATHANWNDALPPSIALADYMFPGQGGNVDMINMVQPAFLTGWYSWGLLGAFGLLVVIFVVAILMLRVSGLPRTPNRVDWTPERIGLAYAACHLVYYSFQIDFYELFISGYGVVFPLLPSLAIAAARFGLGRVRPVHVLQRATG